MSLRHHFCLIASAIACTLLGAGCSGNKSGEEPLRVWCSKQVSAVEKSSAASLLVTNGMKRSEVVRILGQPDAELHRNGYSSGTVGNESPLLRGSLQHMWFDEEELIYKANDGKHVCLRFNIVGFESDLDARPLIGISVAASNHIHHHD